MTALTLYSLYNEQQKLSIWVLLGSTYTLVQNEILLLYSDILLSFHFSSVTHSCRVLCVLSLSPPLSSSFLLFLPSFFCFLYFKTTSFNSLLVYYFVIYILNYSKIISRFPAAVPILWDPHKQGGSQT